MHVVIANPRWRGKRSRHSRRMHNLQVYVSGKRPMVLILFTRNIPVSATEGLHHSLENTNTIIFISLYITLMSLVSLHRIYDSSYAIFTSLLQFWMLHLMFLCFFRWMVFSCKTHTNCKAYMRYWTIVTINIFSPVRRQIDTWTNVALLPIRHLRTSFCGI